MYDLLLKGGRLMDPAQGIDEKKDVAISRGKVVDVGQSISTSSARRVVDLSGRIVAPGFVDLHAHVAHDVIRLSVDPEKVCLPNGTTTVVDAGSTGELNFTPFRRFVVDECETRILAFVNVESLGMIEFADQPNSTDQRWPALITGMNDAFAPMFAHERNLTSLIRRNRKVVVGIKWAHHGLPLLKIARRVADDVKCPIMAENVLVPDSVKLLKRGDIITHLYLPSSSGVDGGPGNGLTANGSRQVLPEFFEASKRGVLMDIGHGKGSFSWEVAALALKEGLPPDTISTDLWVGNVNGPVFDMPTTMSKLLHLGLDLGAVVKAATSTPASAIGMSGRLGTLEPGAAGDVACFKLVEGKHPLVDVRGKKRMAERLIVVTDVVKGGRVVKSSGSPSASG